MISALVSGWIEDGTLARSQEARRRDGAKGQRICRDTLADLQVVGHRNASFAWVPLDAGVRVDPIMTRLREAGISVSGADPFATTCAVPQALRLAFGGIPQAGLAAVLGRVREAITAL